MFLVRRASQPEYFDAPERTEREVQEHYAWLSRINRLTHFDRPFRHWLPKLLGVSHCQKLELLDLGAGDGSLGRTLQSWAQTQGWDWRFSGLDLSPHTRALNPPDTHFIGSVTALPFREASFDVVIATTMTHHLQTEAEVVTHFREAARVARRAVLLCDLHRNPLFLSGLWSLLIALRVPAEFRQDGVLSVLRGWRVPEWRRLADTAGLSSARVWQEHGTRVLLALKK